MKTVWTEDDATPGTEGHVTLSAAWKKRYGTDWKEVRKTSILEEDGGDCTVFTLPDGRQVYESWPGANEIREPDNYAPAEYIPENNMKGWITYHLEDRGLLLYLGVTLIELTESTDMETPNMFQQKCEMSQGTFKKLEPLWGQFIWGLE